MTRLYQACYCEENVWHLLDEFKQYVEADISWQAGLVEEETAVEEVDGASVPRSSVSASEPVSMADAPAASAVTAASFLSLASA